MSDTDKISCRINVLADHLGKNGNTLGKDAGLGNATVDRWMDKDVTFRSALVDKFINHYNINRDWWKTGQGEIFKPEANKIELYERLLKATEESKDTALKSVEDWQRQSEKWEAEASRLGGLLELALRSKLAVPQ